MTTWNIYGPDGHYIGQSRAVNADTAFRQYMPVIAGVPSITTTEIQATEIAPSVCEITYKKEIFTVRAVT